MNLCRLAQSLESDTVLLIFKNMYPHQACVTEIHPRNLGLNQDLHESLALMWNPKGKYMGSKWEVYSIYGIHIENMCNVSEKDMGPILNPR